MSMRNVRVIIVKAIFRVCSHLVTDFRNFPINLTGLSDRPLKAENGDVDTYVD